jgi:hypothetical protein
VDKKHRDPPQIFYVDFFPHESETWKSRNNRVILYASI